MPISVTRTERKTERQDAVLRALRSRIVGGEYPPGSRLPNRLDIEQQYAASSITVQRALERLKEEGFVTASRRNGTYVVPEPPHLTNIALVFPSRPRHPMWNRFWTSLCQVTAQLNERENRKIRVYYGVDGHEDAEDYQHLVRAVERHQLAGIIFGNTPIELRNTPLLDEPNLPRVAIMSGTINQIPHVYPLQQSLIERGFAHLASLGVRRVGVLQTIVDQSPIIEAAARHGLELRPYWRQRISLWNPETARGVTHLMMHAGPQQKPEALLVVDDNLLQPALLGLEDAGVVVGQDVQVVSHCNLPWPVESPETVVKLGFDSRQVLAACLESLELQRQGEPFPSGTAIPALFAHESAPPLGA